MMNKKLGEYYHSTFHAYLEALLNISIFLPYFFSVRALMRTLFDPWKNLTAGKTERGFSFQEWFNRLGFNLVSRGMGFMMRSSILIAYFFIQILYMLALPFAVAGYFIVFPFMYLFSGQSNNDDKKMKLKEQFIMSHMVNQDNYQEIEKWFEQLYAQHLNREEWWKLSSLQSYPPLARDWAAGYTPTLDEYTQELTSSAYQSYIKHIVDREKEIGQIERILSKSEEANVLLVGEDGVGRRTVVDALAKKIYEGKINPLLQYKRVLKVNMERILTQFLDQKQREEFLQELLQEAAVARSVILVIENFDIYVSRGEGRIDLSIAFEKYANTTVQLIGITTPFLFEKYIQSNHVMSRIFSKIDITEVSREEALQILLDTTVLFEQRYQVYIAYETLVQAIEKSDFYMTSQPFPEKAMQLLDNACVYTTQTLKKNVVFPQVIDTIMTERTHVPTVVTTEMKEKLLKLESLLKVRIVSQKEAIDEVASALRRSFLLLGKRKKPLASFLFLGPTGVGKTETAKAIAEVFFESEKSLMRFDMSAYQTKLSMPELIGSAETQNPGLLTKVIREQPYGVLLLDEMEKADKDLLNIFLTILDEGYFTDGSGERVDCKNLVIVATSNAGANFIYEHVRSTLAGGSGTTQTVQKDSTAPQQQTQSFSQILIHHLVENRIFAPEFLNRFDGVVAYQPLEGNNIIIVAKKFLANITEQIFSVYKIKIRVSDETLRNLAQKSYDPAFGARDMQRILRQEIEDKIAKMIFEGKAKEGDTIQL